MTTTEPFYMEPTGIAGEASSSDGDSENSSIPLYIFGGFVAFMLLIAICMAMANKKMQTGPKLSEKEEKFDDLYANTELAPTPKNEDPVPDAGGFTDEWHKFDQEEG